MSLFFFFPCSHGGCSPCDNETDVSSVQPESVLNGGKKVGFCASAHILEVDGPFMHYPSTHGLKFFLEGLAAWMEHTHWLNQPQ